MPAGRTVVYSSWLPPDCGGSDVVAGIQEACARAGYCLETPSHSTLSVKAREVEEKSRVERCISDPGVAGLVIMPYSDRAAAPHLARMVAAAKPVVFLDRVPPGLPDTDRVGIDNRMAARDVVEHLLSLGHRHIAHITTLENVTCVRERHQGYREALERAGIAYRDELVAPHDHDETGITVPAELLARLRRLPNRPTAVFAVHDWVAIPCMVTAQLSGVRVPHDLAVAGFDGIERYMDQRPTITTVEVPYRRLGHAAASLLIERIASGARQHSVRHVYLDAPVRERFSTVGRATGSLLEDGAWRVRVVVAYIAANLSQPLTDEKVAGVATTSVSTLLHDFRRWRGGSPMREVTQQRLDAVRSDLLRPGPGTTVSVAAASHGVTHPGRFSARYRERFGETPSETLRRSRTAR